MVGPRAGICQEKASAEIRGEFLRTKSRVNFAGDFLVDFFGPFSLEKIGRKIPPKNPRQNSNRNLRVSRPKSTLQESGLENFREWLFSAPRMTGRRSHWTERGDDNIFLRLAIVVRLFLLWLRMGLLSWHPLV